MFYDGTVVAVDFSGDLVWKNSDVEFFSLHGLGASPLIAGDQLVMPFDGSSREESRVGWKIPWDKAVVVSLDTATGKRRWKGVRGQSRVGHVTPILVDGGAQIVSAGGDRVQGFDSRTGKRIWSIYSQGEGVTPSSRSWRRVDLHLIRIRRANDSSHSLGRRRGHNENPHRVGAKTRRAGACVAAVCGSIHLHDHARQYPALH